MSSCWLTWFGKCKVFPQPGLHQAESVFNFQDSVSACLLHGWLQPMQSDWEHRSCRHRLGRQSQGRSGSQAWSCAHCALCWWWRGPHAGRLPEKTKINIIIKHLSTHISIFSSAMALENVQNRFFGLKTVKVVLKQVFQWEKGQISPLPLETQLTYLESCCPSAWTKTGLPLSSKARASWVGPLWD